MSHSVSQHLRLEIDTYDTSIRQFIRGYEEMLEVAVSAILDAGDLRRVVDLGAGTGALSERLLSRHPTVVVELWDIDPEMLGKARQRLAAFGERAVFRQRSYIEPIDESSDDSSDETGDERGKADGVMASLALHHLRELDDKRALYRSIAAGLRPGGVFANADVTIPEEPEARQSEYRAWADHQVACGIEEAQAWQHFEDWSEEDRYFPLEVEQAGIEQGGLIAECRWRRAPSTVLVGTRPGD